MAAFSRGIANCNNVTMASSQPPGFCSNVTKSSTIIPMAANASDAYWSNEANWYPVNGVQDYYVQYIHAARLDNQGNIVPGPTCPTSGCFNIFAVPNGAIPNGVANSNQGLPMGMGYGFGYDENPVYVSGPAQVPSKLDPIPTAWGTGLSLAVIIGRSQPSQGAAHDFNADGKSDVLWYNTSSGQVLEWLIDAATVIGGGSPGTAASPWAIVGQRDFNGDGYGDILWRNGSSAEWTASFARRT